MNPPTTVYRHLISICILVLSVYTAACDRAADAVQPKETFVFHPPHLVDSFEAPYTDCNASKWMGYAGIRPLYIGPLADTLDVTCRHTIDKYITPNEIRSYVNYPTLEDSGLYILVDTSQRVRYKILLFNFPSRENPDTVGTAPPFELYEAYPVFIVNMLADTIEISPRHQLPTVLEAIDDQGKWRPIQKTLGYCGTGEVALRLPACEMVVAAISVCSGDFPTQLRLRYHNMYSNSWHGSIYREQFGKK